MPVRRALIPSLMAVAAVVVCWISGEASELLTPVVEKITAREDELGRGEQPALERGRLLLETGRHDEALGLVDELGKGSTEERLLAVEVLLAVNDFVRAKPLIENLVETAPDDNHVARVGYRWWVIEDDLARVDRTQKKRIGEGNARMADYLASANLSTMLLDFNAAVEKYEHAITMAVDAADSAEALHGLGVAFYRKRDFDTSYGFLRNALSVSAPDPDLLMDLSNTLIRLGQTADAIDAAKLAIRIAPYHERAHYLVGNGYADKNYTELMAAYPGAFADEEGRRELERADELLAVNKPAEARRAYEAIAKSHPGWAEPPVRLGSLDFALRDFESARREFAKALEICPEYGRAHNGMAKALEGQRLAVEVHRQAYEEAFAAKEMPEIDGIEKFVLNWNSLSPRHRKQVALSVEPWKRYIPVLVESGSTYYIKPLYELLSETPGQEVLRDQRISYDSRLWDDVRGCGGYNTVTGVEDVERTILDRYNTVLHELSHQVHAVLPQDLKRRIQELYRRAKERDQAGEDAFLSRYAGGSVWEYLAEGANSLKSPRRDAYDTREIVRERLDEKDPDLRELVLELMNDTDVESCYAVAYSNRGDDRLEKGNPAEAIAAYEQAIDREPENETALSSLVHALDIAERQGDAFSLAEEKHKEHEQSAALALVYAEAIWTSGRGLAPAIEALTEARAGVRDDERYLVDLELGRLNWTAGNAEAAKQAYMAVLEYQADSPEGLWGMGAAEALAENWEAAWKHYEEAVRLRTGVVDLRTDYARDLLRAGKKDEAREQIEAAFLLDAEDPTVLAMNGWLLLEEGDAEKAKEAAAKSLERGPWCDLSRAVLARAETSLGNSEAATAALAPVLDRIARDAPPEYVYRPKWGRYDQVHTLSAVERAMIPRSE